MIAHFLSACLLCYGCDLGGNDQSRQFRAVSNDTRLQPMLERAMYKINDAWIETGHQYQRDVSIKWGFVTGDFNAATFGDLIVIDDAARGYSDNDVYFLIEHEAVHALQNQTVSQQSPEYFGHPETIHGVRVKSVIRWW